MKKVGLAFLAMAAVLAITPSALASPLNPISGSEAVGGFFDSWDAHGIQFFPLGGIATGTGTLALEGSGWASLSDFSFSSPDVELFSVDGLVTFTITGPVDVVSDTSSFLNLTGTGVMTEWGYASTPATFTLTSTNDGISGFTISANASPTPEPGSLLLLGTGLFALAILLFRKAKQPRWILQS
jgi:PEP-CTERM motif